MTETQETINAWATETFGPPASVFEIAVRANCEVAELLRVLSYDPECKIDRAAVEDEFADVTICLMHLEAVMCVKWGTNAANRFFANALADCTLLNRDFARLVDLLRPEVEWASGEAQNKRYLVKSIERLLLSSAKAAGIDLQAVIDAKMAVNRERRWVLKGNGTGQHVREDAK